MSIFMRTTWQHKFICNILLFTQYRNGEKKHIRDSQSKKAHSLPTKLKGRGKVVLNINILVIKKTPRTINEHTNLNSSSLEFEPTINLVTTYCLIYLIFYHILQSVLSSLHQVQTAVRCVSFHHKSVR